MENFWDSNTWGTYLILGILFVSLLLANVLKRKIPLLRKSLIPTSVLGGASLAGGAGSVLGTLLGTILIILIDNIGTQFGIGAFVMQVVTGCVIVAAIVIDQLKKKNKR